VDWEPVAVNDARQGNDPKQYYWRDAVLTSRGDSENIRGPHAGCGNGQEVCNQELERVCVVTTPELLPRHTNALCASITTKSGLAGLP
jgi:hypothetical protein